MREHSLIRFRPRETTDVRRDRSVATGSVRGLEKMKADLVVAGETEIADRGGGSNVQAKCFDRHPAPRFVMVSAVYSRSTIIRMNRI